MELNLNNFVNAMTQKEEVKAPSVFNTVADKTKSAGSSVVGAVKSVAPVTNGKFDKYVAKANEEMGNLDERIWNVEFQLAMIAQATGVNLPSEEQMKEYRKQWLEEEAARIKAEQEAKATQPANAGEAIMSALSDPNVAESLKETFLTLFGLKTPEKEELIVEPVTEVQEEEGEEIQPAPTPKPKKKPATAPKPQLNKNTAEWKQCVECGTDISVVYKGDTCPHCKRTKQAEKVKNGTAPRPRIQFDN